MNNSVTILATDTSSPQGSLALLQKSESSVPEVLYSTSWQKARSHSEVITLNFLESLKETGLVIQDISALAVGIGPGSFTGVRVSLNFIRTLGYSLGLPVTPVNSLLALAGPHLVPGGAPVLSMVNAYKNLIYTASYSKKNSGQIVEHTAPCSLSVKDLELRFKAAHVCIGDAWTVFSDQLSPSFFDTHTYADCKHPYPTAVSLGALSLDNGFEGSTSDWSQIKPLYIRASEAEEKLKVGLLKPLPKI